MGQGNSDTSKVKDTCPGLEGKQRAPGERESVVPAQENTHVPLPSGGESETMEEADSGRDSASAWKQLRTDFLGNSWRRGQRQKGVSKLRRQGVDGTWAAVDRREPGQGNRTV